MDMQHHHRGVRYSDSSNLTLQNAGRDQVAIDTVLSGVEWALANKPEEFPEIPGTMLRVAKTHEIRMRLYFVFDDSVVEIVEVEFC